VVSTLMSVTHGQCNARSTVILPAAERHRPLIGTELYWLVTGHAQGVNYLLRVVMQLRWLEHWRLQPLASAMTDLRLPSRDLSIASPTSNSLSRYASQWWWI